MMQLTSVETLPVERRSISDQVRSFGTVQAVDRIQVTPQISERIVAVHADLGDSVRAGDVLAEIYDVPFRDAFEQAQAQLRQSESVFSRDSTQFVRQQVLAGQGAISQSEFDEARAQFQSSRAQLEGSRAALTQSRENLAQTRVRAPVTGVVLSRTAVRGDLAAGGQPLFELANTAAYEIRLWLSMEDWMAARVGMPVDLRRSNQGSILAEGVVTRMSPQLDEVSGLGEVVVTLQETTDEIRQGMLLEARVRLQTLENVIVVPRSALIDQVETYIEPETNTVEIRRNYTVFVAQGDSVAHQRQLELGLEQGEQVQVLSGLEEGESLIVTGHRSLSDQGRIRVPELREPARGGGELREPSRRDSNAEASE
ncbi:MAG: efflux RND transporter periplasmic adaptor subunit [Balneolaceae bacterium]